MTKAKGKTIQTNKLREATKNFDLLLKEIQKLRKTKDLNFKNELIEKLELLAVGEKCSFVRLYKDQTSILKFLGKYLRDISKGFKNINDRLLSVEAAITYTRIFDQANKGQPMTVQKCQDFADLVNLKLSKRVMVNLNKRGVIKQSEVTVQ